MPVRLRILSVAPGADGPAVERVVEIPDPFREIRIGRRPDLEVPLPFAALAPLHARIFRAEGGGFCLEDLGSRGGTWLGAERLAAGAPRPLPALAELALAEVALVFEGEAPARGARGAEADGGDAAPVEGTATIARRLVRDLFAAGPRRDVPELEVVAGPEPGRRLALAESDRPYLAGRGVACDLALVVEEISREHAAFVWTAEGVVARDLGSKNGVVVAGARIDGSRHLHDGDRVELGPVTLLLHDPVDRYLRALAPAAAGPETPAAPAPEIPETPETPETPAAAPAPAAPRFPAHTIAIGFSLVVLAVVAAAALALAISWR